MNKLVSQWRAGAASAVSLVMAISPVPALRASESLAVLPDSAAGLAMVGGRFANLTDPSTLRSNPANLVALEQFEAQVNASLWHGDITFNALGGGSVEMDDPWKQVASLFFAGPVRRGELAVGLGINTPFGLDSAYPQNGVLKYLIPHEAQLLTLDFMPVVAFKPHSSLSLGAGLEVMYSRLSLTQLFPWAAVTAAPDLDGDLDFEADGWGVGGFAGVTWEPVKGHRFSVIGRLPITIDYEGDFEADSMPASLVAAGFARRSDFRSEIKFPGSLAVGYGVDVTEKLTLGLDFQWSDNSVHESVPLTIGPNQGLLGAPGVALNWEDSIDVGVGAQYRLNEHWVLRAGYLFSEASQPDRHYTPSVPSGERHLLTGGVGWARGDSSIDLTYGYAHFPDREIRDNVQPAFNGTYEIAWHVLFLSYRHLF